MPKVLTSDEREALLATFNTRYQGSYRNLIAVRLMLDCGLRSAEATALRVQHVNLQSCRITVRDGKGGKDRIVYMSAELRDLVADWLESDLRPQSELVICTRDGDEVDTRQLREMVKRQACKAQIAECERVSCHTLRHSFATEMYRETRDLVAVQKALGHSDISTTQIYAHLAANEVETGMRKLWGQEQPETDGADLRAQIAAMEEQLAALKQQIGEGGRE